MKDVSGFPIARRGAPICRRQRLVPESDVS